MKSFLIKMSGFLAIVGGIQLLLPLPQPIQYKIKKSAQSLSFNAPVVYFGDSTLKWTAPSDKVKATMPMLLKQFLPGVTVMKYTFPSYQPDLYLYFCKYFIKKSYFPKLIIVPINLRSFSPEWDRQPIWQFEEEEILFNLEDTPLIKFYQPLSVFQFMQPRISRYDYENTPVYRGDKLVGKVRDFDNEDFSVFSEEHLRKKLILRYMYPLKPSHRKVRSLQGIAELAKQNGMKVLFYITPIDYQSGVAALGEEFLVQVKKNVKVIADALEQKGMKAIDLSLALPTADFSWTEDEPDPLYPNEHLKLRGRMVVVAHLVEALRLLSAPEALSSR